MATCYRCGAPNANNRRETYTGHSKGNWWSSRSSGGSSRTYFGVRSVCDDCAKSIDTWKTIKFIFSIIGIIIMVLLFSNSSSKSSKHGISSQATSLQDARVISKIGLNLRQEPNSNSIVLLTIPYNETVNIIEKMSGSETNSEEKANWFKVDYNGTTGWAWSGYLQTP